MLKSLLILSLHCHLLISYLRCASSNHHHANLRIWITKYTNFAILDYKKCSQLNITRVQHGIFEKPVFVNLLFINWGYLEALKKLWRVIKKYDCKVEINKLWWIPSGLIILDNTLKVDELRVKYLRLWHNH